MTYSFESEHQAERMKNKLNKEAGRKIWVVIEENDEWLVISIYEIVRENLR